jgi:hypothetical protein
MSKLEKECKWSIDSECDSNNNLRFDIWKIWIWIGTYDNEIIRWK